LLALKRVTKPDASEELIKKTRLLDTLLLLSKLLREYHGEKVYLLIDEYDALFNFMLEKRIDQN